MGLSQRLLLKSGDYRAFESVELFSPMDEWIDGFTHKIIFFSTVPNESQRLQLKQKGIVLLDYLPEKAYLAAISASSEEIDYSEFNITLATPVLPEYKLSEQLSHGEIPHWAYYGDHSVELVAQFYPFIALNTIRTLVEEKGFHIVEQGAWDDVITLRVPLSQLDELFAMNCFQYFQSIDPAGEPENLPGRTSHRSNYMWTTSQNGLKFRGDDFKVMMQDDGMVGPHIDFEGRLDQSACSPCSTSPDNNHGDHVGGTIMGAGNLDPRARGMAHGAELLVYNSSNNNYNAVPSLYTNQDVFITSKSYSNGCNSGYTSLTRSLDQQVRQLPSLMHVFSAGNSGNDDCGYGAGSGWGNITGGHKSGKNVVAVGNLTNFSTLNGSSSRGPATDGRIKPDICGVGTQVLSTIYDNQYAAFTGTSMSCPGVSGTLTQLYEAYAELNSGDIPHAGLMKGIMLNTADDLGNPGPDFQFGWGSINARRAFQVINDQTYIADVIEQGEENTHVVSVPANVKQLRVMVYWTDFEGSTNASIALVNDLDMTLETPDNSLLLPWLLDPTPAVANLNAPAAPGVDHLNNMEQITIDHPDEGDYVVHITGFNVPQGPQSYHVIYYFEQEELFVTYPLGGESLQPGTNELIRWDASAGEDEFAVSYSIDNGQSWTLIGNPAAHVRVLSWNVPIITSGEALVKVERNGIEATSEDVFSILATPTDLAVEWSCPDSLLLNWNPIADAVSYEVSMLGVKYMDSIATVSDTFLVVHLPSTESAWFSVKSNGPDNSVSERAIAIHRSPGEFGCLWSAPYAEFTVNCESEGAVYCYTVEDLSINTDASSSITWYFPGGSPSMSTDPSTEVCYPEPGMYDVAMVVDNGFGVDSVYQINAIQVIPVSELTYFEGFEYHTSFINNPYWERVNISGGAAFQINTNVARSGEKCASLTNFNQPVGSIDELISGPIDLSEVVTGDDITLSFRYAYRKRQADNDEWLRVFLMSSCDGTWLQRRTIRGNNLSPEIATTSWSPSSMDDWTTVHMTNLTSQFFTGDFRMKFQFESDGGNNFYLDDINLYLGAPSDDLVADLSVESVNTEWTVYPNPSAGELFVRFELLHSADAVIQLEDLTGRLVAQHLIKAQVGDNLVMLNEQGIPSGTYILRFIHDQQSSMKKIVIH